MHTHDTKLSTTQSPKDEHSDMCTGYWSVMIEL